MDTYRTTVVVQGGRMLIEDLPFGDGTRVQVTVTPSRPERDVESLIQDLRRLRATGPRSSDTPDTIKARIDEGRP